MTATANDTANNFFMCVPIKFKIMLPEKWRMGLYIRVFENIELKCIFYDTLMDNFHKFYHN